MFERFVGEERRRHERFTAPAVTLAFNGGRHTTESWSLGGFVVDGYQGSLSAGALLVVEGICAPDGVMTTVEARARVIRLDRGRGRLVVSFLGLDGSAYAVLRDLMAARMRSLEEQRFG
ncbi:MAG: hypothetical protein ACFCUO_04310 [Rhodospirillales bacterium]